MKKNRGGRPKGSGTNVAKGLPEAKRVQFRMYPQNLSEAQDLVEMGYGRNRADVVRKALREAWERNRIRSVKALTGLVEF